ncbi:helix-turn-helix domain-containing protein [Dyadobacter tibetensis]|uniref:helix-turn-helix domain-containing protein n=1 Tax=Dyadobacter tibetensis TaxID=1211851 RepID=UPI00046E577A|nr:helix-turn-helix transcriptional regulator [Dyadobacter tibetensis]
MNQKRSIPEKLRNLRLAKGLSQENMADLLHISTTAYGDLERGKTEMTLSRLESVAEVLAVALPDLLGLDTDGLPEIDYLRQENARLIALNGRLHNELEQWKQWYWLLTERQQDKQRNPIGF